MKKIYSPFLILLFIGINITFSQNLTVVTMPSWTNNHNEGNAIVNQPITVWGAMFGDNIALYQVMLCVDNVVVTTTPVATNGSYANGHYIEYSYTPTTTGCKLVTLKVLAAPNDTIKSESYIKVFSASDPSIDSIIVNMMIDKGLLFLFKNATLVSANNVQWTSIGTGFGNAAEYTYAGTCAAVLAFEEQHHLYVNGLHLDPYADLVQSGLNNIFLAAGTNCLLNASWNNSTSTYVNGLGLVSIIMAQPNASIAKTEVNSIVNKTYYTFDSLAVQSIYTNQALGTNGCWHYDLDANDDHTYDGSAQQWPMLILLANQQRYNMPLVATYVNNGISCYLNNLCSSGGTPYYGSACTSRENVGMTGGMLAAFALVNKYWDSDATALQSMTFVMNSFNTLGFDDGWGGWANGGCTGWPASLYHMYGMKKGLYIQQHNTLKPFTINGTTIDWYANLAAWLSGEKAFALNPTLKTNNSNLLSAKYSYGQYPNGHWNDGVFLADSSYYLSTAFAILILSRNMFQQQNIVTPIPVSMCKGDSVQLIASPGKDYVWTPTTNLDHPNIQKPWASPDTTTTYYATYLDVANCPVGDTAYTVNVKPIPSIAVSVTPQSMCNGDTAKISLTVTKGHEPYLYKWSNKDSIVTDNTVSSINVMPTITTTYTITVSDSTSCGYTKAIAITVKPAPKPLILGDSTVCVGAQRIVYTTDNGMSNYIWAVSGGHITTNNGSMILVFWTIAGHDTVTVSYTGANGCTGITYYPVTVNVLPVTPTITQQGSELVSSSVTGNQWYNANGPIAGDTSSTFTPPGNGYYYVIVTKDGCASLPSNGITLGIGVISNPNNLIKIYPNPAKDIINIELLTDNNNFKNLMISLYDIEGKELLNIPFYNLQTKQISTKEFAKGVYYLKIYNDNLVVFNKILII